MFYINQQDYPHIPYRTNMQEPDSYDATKGTVHDAACGPCSMMIVAERLGTEGLTLSEALQIAADSKSNMEPGTDMDLYGPACGDRLGLSMRKAGTEKELEDALRNGAAAIVNVSGDADGYTGVLSDEGHYVAVIAFTGKEFVVLDPAYRPGKYDIEVPNRAGKVRENGKILYVSPQVLKEDTERRYPGYYIFERKSNV